MRIKNDFITNSSSTAFIVLVPNNYELSEDDFDHSYDLTKIHHEESELSLEECKEIIETLKKGENIYANGDGDGGVSHLIWQVILDILDNNGFLLNTLDTPSENPDIIIGVDQEDIDEILLGYIDVQKIIKTCNSKGVENDKSVTKK